MAGGAGTMDDWSDAKPELWVGLASKHGGQPELGRRRRIKRIVFPHGQWEIVFEEYTESSGESSQRYTRCRVRYGDRQEFRMRIFRDNFFLRVAKRLGLQDLSVPVPEVDERFVVQSNNASIVQSIVLTPDVHELLLALDKVSLEATHIRQSLRKVPDVSELRCRVTGRVKDVERLELLLALTRGTLDAMARLGVATDLPSWT